jgi:hypothetical protein
LLLRFLRCFLRSLFEHAIDRIFLLRNYPSVEVSFVFRPFEQVFI